MDNDKPTIQTPDPMQIVVVAGMSGAGKTVAIKALEDCGYYPLDHLPADAIGSVLESLALRGEAKVAIGLDLWDPHFFGDQGAAEDSQGWRRGISKFGDPRLILLEASNEALLRRYGETRRKHPLARDGVSLTHAIGLERSALEANAKAGHRVDTSEMSPHTLKAYVKGFLDLSNSHMDICIESFGFKHGAPAACDLIFDARCLPNPYYDKSLRPLTGLDEPVRRFFMDHPKPLRMAEQIARFVAEWKPDYERDHRSYLTVGVGCTGGQHRSVFVAEAARQLLAEAGVEARTRHREAARWPAAHAPEGQP